MSNKFSVYQHWDPLRVCMVGRSYPPEFYQWIKVPHVRALFEKIAQETEEDFQSLITILEKFGVEVLRPDIPTNSYIDGRYLPPPMTPRDHMVMIGETFYKGYALDICKFYKDVKDPSWPECNSDDDFHNLPSWIQKECYETHYLQHYLDFYSSYNHIFERIKNYNVSVKEVGKQILFMRKLRDGGSEHSFGIHVAKLAGMPQAVLTRAEEILFQLEKSHEFGNSKSNGAKKARKESDSGASDNMQLSFFQLNDPVLEQIREELVTIDINTLTPVEALMKLNDIKKLTGG
jgi:hypothetical protein